MTRYRYVVFAIMVGALMACTSPQSRPMPDAQLNVVALDRTVPVKAGQTVYVPIYSHIYMWEQNRTLNLTATLSVRNTDMAHPIILTSVNYYDSDGQQLRNYLEQPVELKSLASTSFVVDQEDTQGGSGASFVVQWVAQHDVTEPVIESVMINTSGSQGVSFISPGRIIKSQTNGE